MTKKRFRKIYCWKDRPLFLEEHERAIYDEWDKALKSRGLVNHRIYEVKKIKIDF